MAKYSVMIEAYTDIDLVSNRIANIMGLPVDLIRDRILYAPCILGSTDNYDNATTIVNAVIEAGGKASIIYNSGMSQNEDEHIEAKHINNNDQSISYREKPHTMQNKNRKHKSTKTVLKNIGNVILALILISLFVMAIVTSVKDTAANKPASNAKICAEKAVKDKLKAPSTAKFCKYTEMVATNIGGNRWRVSGYVDAQNSFGAVIRSNWTVKLTLTEHGFTDYTVNIS